MLETVSLLYAAGVRIRDTCGTAAVMTGLMLLQSLYPPSSATMAESSCTYRKKIEVAQRLSSRTPDWMLQWHTSTIPTVKFDLKLTFLFIISCLFPVYLDLHQLLWRHNWNSLCCRLLPCCNYNNKMWTQTILSFVMLLRVAQYSLFSSLMFNLSVVVKKLITFSSALGDE